MWELYDAVPETVAEKALYYAGISGVTVGCLLVFIIAGGFI